MGKQLTKLQRRKDARKELDAIDERRELALIIHYSCESFYDGPECLLSGEGVAIASVPLGGPSV